MTINEVTDRVISSVDNSWSTLEKIRYVYLAVGKMLSKYTDFFFSVDNKLAEQQLSMSEIEDVYEDDKSSGDLRVICRSAAYILERIYSELGIKSELVKSNNNVINYEVDDKSLLINHWFLAVYDDDGKAYFLTLASDLPYIQTNMQTRHFATNIPYRKMAKNGDIIQVYCGDEIEHTVLSDAELRELDMKVGYIKHKYNYDENYKRTDEVHYNYDDAALHMLNNELKSNKLYMELEGYDTHFYKRLTEFKNGDKVISFCDTPKDEITSDDWNVWLRKLCHVVHRRLDKIIGYRIMIKKYYDDPEWNYNEWIEEVCKQIQRYIFQYSDKSLDHLWIQGEFNYSRWSRAMKREEDLKYNELDVDNIMLMLDKTNVLANYAMSGKPPKNFMSLFSSLGYHFVKREHTLEGAMVNGTVSSKYIAHKFKVLFTRIFSCNEELIDLNKMEYSEQIVIIKMILDRMFPELTSGNAIMEDFYNENYSLVQNRIQVYSLKHKVSGEYAVVFHVLGDETMSDSYFFYDLKKNKFKIANILKINKEYTIVSDRFKSRIEEMEQIIEKKNKR